MWGAYMKESELMATIKELEIVGKCEHKWEIISEEAGTKVSVCKKCGIRETVIFYGSTELEGN